MKTMRWRPFWRNQALAILLAALALVAGCTGKELEPAATDSVASPAATTILLPKLEALPAAIPPAGLSLAVPLIRQADPRWKDVSMGVNGPGIGAEGCALTCFAMVASFYGTPTTPPQANTLLAKYAYPLEWMAGESRYGLHILRKDSVRFRDSRLHDAAYVRDTIEDSLVAGHPVIIGILQVSTGAPHFVVAYGLEPAGDKGFRILVRDPSMNYDYARFEDIPTGWMITRLVVYQA